MNDRVVGFLLSGASHAACLSLLLFLPAAKAVPISTFHIRFEQREVLPEKAAKPAVPASVPVSRQRSMAPKIKRETVPEIKETRRVMPPARRENLEEAVRPTVPMVPTDPPGEAVASPPNQDLRGGGASETPGARVSATPSNQGSTSPKKGGDAPPVEAIFGELNAPTFIHRATPVYPRAARRLEKEGRVVLKLLIDHAGTLRNVEVIEPAPFGFTESAVEAVRKSTFAPARRNGERVSSWAVLSIRFNLE
jgi:TonB family protein